MHRPDTQKILFFPPFQSFTSFPDRSKEIISEQYIRKQNVDCRLAKSSDSKEKWFLVATLLATHEINEESFGIASLKYKSTDLNWGKKSRREI